MDFGALIGRPPTNRPAAGDRVAWHGLSTEETLRRLGTTRLGLGSADVQARRSRFGPNQLPEPRRRSLPAIIFGQLRSPLIYLLLAAVVVSVATGDVTDAVFIFLVLAINTGIGALQEANAEANTAALRRRVLTSARVSRDSAIVRIDSCDLVPGDVVSLEAGDRVPADLRLLQAADLETDESMLTGESLPVGKNAEAEVPDDAPLGDRWNSLAAATLVRRGRAIGVVVATGATTEIGRIAGALNLVPAVPPLMRRLNSFSRLLGIASLVLVTAIVGPRLLGGADFRETLLIGVALAISIIPEGLPVAVTVALAIATRRMAKRNVVVRHLPAVEGLGACTVIATDKTGTLTVNQLTAKQVWLPGQGLVAIGGEGLDPRGSFEPHEQSALEAIAALARSAALCSDASFSPPDRTGSGDTVDLAFLVLAAKAGVQVDSLREDLQRLGELPFSAERKFSATLNASGTNRQVNFKGAAEVILPACTGIDAEGARQQVGLLATSGFRVLAVATRSLPAGSSGGDLSGEMHDLTLLGLVAFIDPLRPEAAQAVTDCRRAGVAVKMITGDHPATALAIARQVGIAREQDTVATGADLKAAADGDAAARARVAAASVFARVEPAQKVEIVQALRAEGHYVAMTGDGVNDAPALLQADIGVGMGRDGTDVAREASDLILTDDNFASIVAGIEEGRAAYANIRKVIFLLVGTGAAEAMMFLLALITGLPAPLGAAQLLWLNLVTNGGQDVALALEKPERGLLQKPPRRPSEPIFDAAMMRQTLVSALYIGVVGYAVFAWCLAQGYNEAEARNVLLFLMVLFENVQALNARSETRSIFRVPLCDNLFLVGAVVVAQTVHLAAPFIPGLRDVLEVQPISPAMWGVLLGIALSLLVVTETERALRSGVARGRASVN